MTERIPDPISNSDDIIDSRDIIERIQHLESLAEDEIDEDEKEELESLKVFSEEVSNETSDWKDGATLIHDSYMEDYAREFAEDIGAIGKDQQWPLNHIDWEAAVEEFKMDYEQIDFGGETYWVR